MFRHKFEKLIIFPAIILCLTFAIIPVVYIVVTSFFSVDIMAHTYDFVGMDNYKNIIKNPSFIKTVINTFIYAISIYLSIWLGVFLAIFLKKNTKRHNLVQTIIFTPYIVSIVSITVVFSYLMNPKYGLLNYILTFFHLPTSEWLISDRSALMSVVIIGIWQVVGYNVLILSSGLRKIPSELYEAAQLDRASRLSTTFKITIPMLSPSILFLSTTTFIGSFCTFQLIDLLTQGGPRNSTNLIVYWIYQNGFIYSDKTGEAMAAATLLLFVVGAIGIIQFKYFNRKAYY